MCIKMGEGFWSRGRDSGAVSFEFGDGGEISVIIIGSGV